MASATATLTPASPSPRAVPTLANVLYEKNDTIAYVTVNRPKVLNALNTPTWKDLRTTFENARDDATVRGVILTGAGSGHQWICARWRLRDGDGLHHQDRGG
jgi:1,4-dihydroxy-2-naphthoyl-CoA synthase